ncbi:hypothetical protein [Sphingobium yanoikuyae]|uniref:hypothetical protein n=1 Tax=Sphingobium yanoikuyae TaxID=13690 RepID=UPI000AA78890|nr:hypothetical protein [Sphingobium yanoikuyae]
MMGWAASGRFQTIFPCKKEFATDFSRQLSKQDRHCERSEAIHLAPVDCFATLAMTGDSRQPPFPIRSFFAPPLSMDESARQSMRDIPPMAGRRLTGARQAHIWRK